MKLSENEKRDAIKLLQEDKSLPDKYRFLLFQDDREVELVWNGKTQEVCNLVLPFQTIEHIDEPRSEKIKSNKYIGDDLYNYDPSGRQIQGWANKLIWGDNKLILSSLKNGHMRREIEKQGGLKLIYIDPPFDVGADFSMNVEIGDESFTKKPSVIEEVAYRDTWGKGADSYLAMLYERLQIMKGLLLSEGCIYVHVGWQIAHSVRLILDEIFGKDMFRNEIIWQRGSGHSDARQFGRNHETVLFYSKTENYYFRSQEQKYNDERLEKAYPAIDKGGRRYCIDNLAAAGSGEAKRFVDKMIEPPRGQHWRFSQENIDALLKAGRIVFNSKGVPRVIKYADETSRMPVQDIWTDCIRHIHTETSYATEKPERFIERIIKSSSKEGDLIADFFCGSGTTLAVAEKLGRKWIGSDLGRFAIHTSRKRLIQVQREMKKEGKNFRAFEILNLGKYEREQYINVDVDIRGHEKQQILENKEKQFIELILSAYSAQAVNSYNTFVGKKRDRLVAVGPINTPVSSAFVDEAIKEAQEKGITKFDVLGFDYEMGIDFAELSRQGVDVQFKVIPREVFDRRAVEKGHVKFYDVAYIEVKPIIKGRGNNKTVAVELCDFSVFYNQDSVEETEGSLKEGSSKIVIENGQVIKVCKDKKTAVVTKEVLTKKWTDWVDYWSVDFNMESRKEIIRLPCHSDPRRGEESQKRDPSASPQDDKSASRPQDDDENYKEIWTGGYIFENEWQSFRTKKDRKLELISAEKEVSKGRRKIAVKVVDIFGNDTTRVIEVNI